MPAWSVAAENFCESFLHRGNVTENAAAESTPPSSQCGEFGGTAGRNGVRRLGASFGVSWTGVWSPVLLAVADVRLPRDVRLLLPAAGSACNRSDRSRLSLVATELVVEKLSSSLTCGNSLRSIRTCGAHRGTPSCVAGRLKPVLSSQLSLTAALLRASFFCKHQLRACMAN